MTDQVVIAMNGGKNDGCWFGDGQNTVMLITVIVAVGTRNIGF